MRLVGRVLPVAENAQGRGIGVVELSRPNSPDEGGEESTGHQQGEDEKHGYDGHASPRIVWANRRVQPMARATTVAELVGINTAEISGDRLPLAAKEMPTTL